jgi:hypothetical protein
LETTLNAGDGNYVTPRRTWHENFSLFVFTKQDCTELIPEKIPQQIIELYSSRSAATSSADTLPYAARRSAAPAYHIPDLELVSI